MDSLIFRGQANYLYVDVVKADRNQSTVAFRFWETHQKSEPKDSCTLFTIALECILLYLVPLVYLCVTENAASAGTFAVLGLFSGLRHYMNPGILLVRYENLHFFHRRLHNEDSTDCDTRQRRRNWKVRESCRILSFEVPTHQILQRSMVGLESHVPRCASQYRLDAKLLGVDVHFPRLLLRSCGNFCRLRREIRDGR